ncbi:MAG: PD-(D/E)XK nuclease family transposase [Proteobacteria bacterium]|nr:PD-(D/E)XK nuclease family transposase [Pseudomonadota bacterium]
MIKVAPLRYDVIYKKAFSVPKIFTAFVRDFLDIEMEIDTVETDKTYTPPIGNVAVKFDLYAEDKKNRIIVDIQHVRFPDHYHRFLHYHCAALLEQIASSGNYQPDLRVFTFVILTSGDKHKKDISIIDFDPKDLQGNPIDEIPHKVIYICPKYLDKSTTPKKYHEWLEAIEDSLDEQVDESHYSSPEIQQVFDLIEKKQVTPEELAIMIDEYGIEQIKQDITDKAMKKGLKAGIKEGIKEGLKEGLKKGVKEGEQKAKEKLVSNLLSEGILTKKQIAKVTDLSLEQVQNIKDK